ncbi:uncharacterized protein LOC134785611 [Penaeus indicus]|uniref:uncharacterized protein LOC134785611 n=1 Tax=Penaeus indicus TaxID=29960 RepID=UPI00300D2D90
MSLWLRSVPRLRAAFLPASASRLALGDRRVLREEPRQRVYFSRSLSSGDVKWLWPIDRESLLFHLVHDLGSRMGIFLMTLNSVHPLKTEDVESALFHLQRKNLAMRVDIRIRDDVWWFCEQDGNNVDFKTTISKSTIPNRSLSSGDVKWLWPIDRESLLFHLVHNLGSRMGFFLMTLNSVHPLKTEDVERALFHLQRSLSSGDVKWLWPIDRESLLFHLVHDLGSRMGFFLMTLNSVHPLKTEDVERALFHLQRSLSSGDVKWLWPIDRESLLFHLVHDLGSRMGFFLMTLNSVHPLKTEDVERALFHLQRSLSSGDVKWLWPIDRESLLFHLVHDLGSRMGFFLMTLNSVHPLKTEDVERALFHLQRSLSSGDVKWLWPIDRESLLFHLVHDLGSRMGFFLMTLNSVHPLKTEDVERALFHLQRSLSSGDVKWLWPIDRESLLFHLVHDLGSRMGFFLMTLNSVHPLKTEDVERALFHLQRKNLAMRVDIRNRDDVWWFCEDGNNVDFKMLSEGANSVEECRRMSEGGFPDGATWKFRMIPRGKEAPCVMPEIKEDFPYQYDVLMTSHHALGSGLSVSLIVKRMVELLNDVILDRHIDDEVTSRFSSRGECYEIESRIRKMLEDDPQRHDHVRETMPDASPLLLQAFPRPSGNRATTGYLTRIIDLEATQNFQRQCKAHGVTINGAFTAVVNIALARLMQKVWNLATVLPHCQ